MSNVRFCNCNEFKEHGGLCRHLPPLVLGSQAAEEARDPSFRPLCNCDEWKRLGGSCKHIPPWLSSSSSEVELYPPNKRQRWISPQPPDPPPVRGQAVRFCNCSEFKERCGVCKHLPPLDKAPETDMPSPGPNFQPLCNCDEWKRSGGSCKHIPPWLVPSSQLDDVQLYDPSSKLAQRTGGASRRGVSSPLARGSARPTSPLMFPGYPFCTCTEFKADGTCKHLPDELTHDLDEWELPMSDPSLFATSSFGTYSTLPSSSCATSAFSDDLSASSAFSLSNPFSFLPSAPPPESPPTKAIKQQPVSPSELEASKQKGKRGRKPAELPKQDRNREASDKYRKKKKEKMDDLEETVSRLERTIEEQRAKMDLMATENKGLAEQVVFLRGLVSSFASKGSFLEASGDNHTT